MDQEQAVILCELQHERLTPLLPSQIPRDTHPVLLVQFVQGSSGITKARVAAHKGMMLAVDPRSE